MTKETKDIIGSVAIVGIVVSPLFALMAKQSHIDNLKHEDSLKQFELYSKMDPADLAKLKIEEEKTRQAELNARAKVAEENRANAIKSVFGSTSAEKSNT